MLKCLGFVLDPSVNPNHYGTANKLKLSRSRVNGGSSGAPPEMILEPRNNFLPVDVDMWEENWSKCLYC